MTMPVLLWGSRNRSDLCGARGRLLEHSFCGLHGEGLSDFNQSKTESSGPRPGGCVLIPLPHCQFAERSKLHLSPDGLLKALIVLLTFIANGLC